MKISRKQFAISLGASVLCFARGIDAFGETYSLSGRVSDTAAHPVPSATVSAKSVRNGKTFTTRSNGDGVYTIPNLAPGDYWVWAVAGELRAQRVKVTLEAGETTDIVVSPALHH